MRQLLSSTGVRSPVAWTLIAAILIGPGFAYAQGLETDFGLYCAGAQNAPELMQTLNFTDLPSGPAAGAIIRLAAQGVLRGDGSGRFNPGTPVTKEQAMVALVRLLGWESQTSQAATANSLGTGNASGWAAGYVSVAMERGLTGNDGSGQATITTGDSSPWDAPATRQEVAAWCVRALELTAGARGAYGSMTLAAYSDIDEMDPESASTVQHALELGLLKPAEPGRLVPYGAVTRAELALILDRLARLLPPSSSCSWEVGTLESRTLENEEIAGLPARSTLWTMVRPGGSKTALKLSSDHRDQPLAQAVVLRGGQLVYGSALKVGDSIRYLAQGEQTVPFIEVMPMGPATIKGLIEQIDASTKQLTIRDDGQVLHQLLLAPTASITIAGNRASAYDLASGLEVSATALDGQVIEIAALATPDGYADPPRLEVSGRVRVVDARSLLLVLPDGSMAKYDLNDSTQVVSQGRISTLVSIQPGDLVQVRLPAPTASWAERIVVAGKEARSAELVRGRLGRFAPHGGSMTLTGVQRSNSGLWETFAAILELPLRPDATIWHENRQIDLAAAARLTGAEVYAAVSSGFGRTEVLTAIIWQGQEKSYEGTIAEINPGLGLIALPGAELSLSPGAIVLKDGRLADPYGLQEGDSVQALACRLDRGSLAMVVSVLGNEKDHFPGFVVYRGRVDDMGRTAMTFTSYRTFSDGTWTSRRGRASADLGLGRDTVIMSLLDEDPAILTPDQFRQGFWQGRYDDVEVLAITEDGDILGLALWPDSELDAARLSRAQVMAATDQEVSPETVVSGRGSLVLRNLADFSPAKETWQHAGTKAELGAEQALVIRNGRAYTGEALAPGDDIVFLRRGQTVLLAWVKE